MMLSLSTSDSLASAIASIAAARNRFHTAPLRCRFACNRHRFALDRLRVCNEFAAKPCRTGSDAQWKNMSRSVWLAAGMMCFGGSLYFSKVCYDVLRPQLGGVA